LRPKTSSDLGTAQPKHNVKWGWNPWMKNRNLLHKNWGAWDQSGAGFRYGGGLHLAAENRKNELLTGTKWNEQETGELETKNEFRSGNNTTQTQCKIGMEPTNEN
jgi:hypothetical protein